MASDAAEFLIWCKQACQATTASSVVLDLNEVGEYLSELLQSKQLNLDTLKPAGFEFLQNYFISINENEGTLRKTKKKEKLQPIMEKSFGWQAWSTSANDDDKDKKNKDSYESPSFEICKDPSELKKLDLIWTVVRQASNHTVVMRGINFLIDIYMNVAQTHSPLK